MRRSLILLLALLGSTATTQEVHPRTSYDGRGRPSHIASSEADVPVATPRWRLDISGALRRENWSSEGGSFPDPYVLSDERRLFYIRGSKLHAVDAQTGEQLWTFVVVGQTRLEVGADHLLVMVGQGTVRALDARTGAVRWQRTYHAPEGVETFAVHGDLLVVIVGERFIAYELATGEERWRVRGLYGLTRDPHGTVHSASGSVVFLELGYHSLTSSPDVFGFNRATGERLWRVSSAFTPLAAVGDKVYLLEDDWLTDQNYPGRLNVTAVNLRSGDLLYKRVHHINKKSESVHNHPNPWDYDRVLVHKGVLYAEACRLYTGKPTNVARFALDGAGRPAFVKPGANVEWLAGPYQGKLFVLGRMGGKRRFLVGDVGGSSLAPIQFDDTYQVGAKPISRLDLIGNGLYVGHTDGRFYAVSVQTGRAFFRFRTDAKNFGPTHVIGNTLVVQAGDELLAFNLPSVAKRTLE